MESFQEKLQSQSQQEIAQNSQTEKKSWKALSTAVGGFTWMLYTGSMYTTGANIDYIGAYYNVGSDQTAFVLPAILTLNCIFVIATSKLIGKVNPKIILATGGIVGVGLLFISSFMNTFISWAVVYIFSFAIGNGCTYIVPIHHGWLWYPNSPGLVSGLILAGFGLATLIFNNVSLMVVNPEDSAVITPDIAARVPLMLQILASCYAVIVFISVFMVWQGPEPPIIVEEEMDVLVTANVEDSFSSETNSDEKVQKLKFVDDSSEKEDGDILNQPDDVEHQKQNNNLLKVSQISQQLKQSTLSNNIRQSTPTSRFTTCRSTMISRAEHKELFEKVDDQRFQKALWSKQFWQIYAMLCLSVITGFYTLDIYKLMGEDAEISIPFLTEVGSIAGLFGAARFIWSAALDKFSFRIVYGLLLILQICLSVTEYWARRNQWVYALYVCLITWCEGAHFAIGPNILLKIYGEQATRLYGVMFTYSGILSLAMIGLLASPAGEAYDYFYMVCAVMNLMSLMILLLFFKENPFNYSTEQQKAP